MNAFFELLESMGQSAEPDGSLGLAQKHLDERFPKVVSMSPFHLWSPADPVPRKGKRLLIGVATWSGYDMMLLDALADVTQLAQDLTVDVFNVDSCLSQEALDQYVPGIGPVYQTPAVGFWSDGRLVEKATGKAGRDLVSRVTGLDRAELERLFSSKGQHA